jgi:hypothetical protein
MKEQEKLREIIDLALEKIPVDNERKEEAQERRMAQRLIRIKKETATRTKAFLNNVKKEFEINPKDKLSIKGSRVIFDFIIYKNTLVSSRSYWGHGGIDLKQVIQSMRKYFKDLEYKNITSTTERKFFQDGEEVKHVKIRFDLPKSKSKKSKKRNKKKGE